MNKVSPIDITSGYPRGVSPVPAAAPIESQNVISLQRLIRAVRRRFSLMAAVFVLVFAAVAIHSAQLTPAYTATSRVIANTRSSNVVDIGAVLSGIPQNAAVLDTEAEVLQSRSLIEKLVNRLDLTKSPEFNPALEQPGEWKQRFNAIGSFFRGLVPFGAEAPKPPAPLPGTPEAKYAERLVLDRVIDNVRSHIKVARLGTTYIIEVSATSRDPKMSASIANTLSEVYLDNQLDTKFQATKRAQEWLNERLGTLREDLRTAEGKVEAHRAATGLLRTGDVTLTEQTIRDINSELTVAQSDYATKSARLRNLNEQMRANRGIDNIAEAQTSTAINALRAAQAALSARKADVVRRYDTRHPEYQKVMAEEADNTRQINAELQRIASSLEQEVLISRERVNSLQSSMGRAKGELASNNRAGVEQSALERDAQATRTLYDEFNNRFKQTGELEGITEADAVIDSYAPVPSAPSFPNTPLNLALGFMLGLAIAGLVGFVMELLDNYVSSAEEVEQVAGVPFIGQIPLLPTAGNFTKGSMKPGDYLIDKPHSGFAEAFRHLRASIMFADLDKAAKTVAVVSSLPSEGKTSMTYCLGRMAAMSGNKTIVIDGDIRMRQLTQISGVKAEAGLLEYLFGEARLADAVKIDEQTGLHILPLTDRKHTPRDVFGSRAFDALLNMLQQNYDLIIIDTGPILLMAETRVVTSKVDQVVVATRWRKTNRGTLRETMKILRDFHANVTGVVLTFVDLRKRAHHAYTSANYKAYAKYYHDQ
ncbi:MAG TPA: polysaccharide biosynthesis tyrosine autokinase [Hyphomonadaceae bacterium]|nr:polysaccharide biosynthesis tyrosine autokinase [Hyphomonadaceae bacterium]